jgi:RNA polymerase sigma-70 factor
VNGIDEKLVERLYVQAKGERWRVPKASFRAALEASATRAFAGRLPDIRELERYLASLHLEDLALACACEVGDEGAWEHFVREQRPLLYRAADALEPGGGARDLADSLYGDLFGIKTGSTDRRSLFRYFHGRSSLSTWLRAVLAQRHVDRIRANRFSEPLPDDDSARAPAVPASAVEPERDRYVALIRDALKRSIAALSPRDRLRLACYYSQQLTLAQTGRMLGEHEATASRSLARSRRAIRTSVEAELRGRIGLSDAELTRCFECVAEDAGSLDLRELLDVQL